MRYAVLLVLVALGAALGWGGCVAAPTPEATSVLVEAVSPPPTAAPTVRPSPQATIACTAWQRPGTPTPSRDYLTAADWVDGPSTATVTFVMYGDFQCAACAELARALAHLRQAYPTEVRRVYRHYPLLPLHDKAALAAHSAEAAGRQGAFWPWHDRLFAAYDAWADLTPEAFRALLLTWAREMGLDEARFRADLDDPALAQRVQAAWESGQANGLPGVPLLFLNGRLYTGLLDEASLDTVVRLERLRTRQMALCPPLLADPQAAYFAILHTEAGDLTLQLYPDRAPMAVSSFLFLARQGWYDGLTFFRVVPGQYVQTGDPSETGYGHAGYTFAREVHPDLRFDRPGRVALYSDGPENNSSQVLITLAPLPAWDGQYTIFGQVLSGLEILQALPAREPDDPHAPPPLTLQSISLEERR